MPLEPVKIPQNVYIEDRVIGPLTLRQIFIMIIGTGFSYMIFSSIQKAYGSVTLPLTIIAWTPAVITAAFAMVRVNDLSLLRICLLIAERMSKAPVRTWSSRPGISINIRVSAKTIEQQAADQVQAKQKLQREAQTQERIRELSTFIDKPLDTIEQEPVNHPVAATAEPAMDTVTHDTATEQSDPLPLPPVNPARISVDGKPAPGLSSPPLSDLSVFRDVFPGNPAH